MKPIIKNSLFAMVDLFLDYVSGERVDSQRDNICEFIIDCFNLKEDEPEFKLLKEKFEEEFEETNYFSEMQDFQVISFIEIALEKLMNSDEIPQVISIAIKEVYGTDIENIQYIEYQPTTKDPDKIAQLLDPEAELSTDHGDIIDYEQILTFDQIPTAVKKEIDKHYNFSELDESEFDEWVDDLICRATFSIGIEEDRGFEVKCQNYYFYHLDTDDEAIYVEAQGDFGKEWLKEIYNHLDKLGWKPEYKASQETLIIEE